MSAAPKATAPFLGLDSRATRIFSDLISNRLGVKPNEHVLIFGDTETELEAIQGLATAIANAGGVFTILIQPGNGWDASNLFAVTKPAQGALGLADVVIAATRSNSASTYGGGQYRSKKARTLALTERPFDAIINDTADYAQMAIDAEKLAKLVENSKEVRVTSKKGTDFTAKIDQRSVALHRKHKQLYQVGMCREEGDFAGAPDGEFHFGPVIDSGEGTIVVDGSILNVAHVLSEPVRLEVKKGRITEVSGAREARDLEAVLKRHGNANHISEIGLGLNPVLPMAGESVHLEKKALGNVHLAHGAYMLRRLGDYADVEDMGPHGDMVIRNATYALDGKVIVENARLKL